MKIRLLTLIAIAFMLVSCGKKKSGTDIAASIAPVVKVFDGTEYVDTKLEGNPDYYIIYFSASWCPPCRSSVPQLVKQYNNEISKLDNLELVHVSVDRNLSQAVAWAKKESLPWPTILPGDLNKTMVKDIKTNAVPTYVLIKKNGDEIARAHDSASMIKKFEEVSK
jgi:thiol-disulfide isomerase/thioredoxin